jgi:hypothetical protein
VDVLWTLRLLLAIAILTPVVCMPMLLAGCRQIPLRVDLVPGYSGMVTVACTLASNRTDGVTVDATGYGQIARCPKRSVVLVIMRGGKSISSEGPINWDSTGDGITVGFHFSVH